ncbi:MAG: glycosyltransferase [Muribaculaceae bacterium]|nr:glycosyltransferase [Muribaculaceae bacterium]
MLLSICIPCYKRINEVRNTLNSIYSLNADVSIEDYQVVISDNDPEGEIEQLLQEFPYKNLKYFKTKCEGFMNSFHVLTYADGEFLKLHNSQSMFREGSIRAILDDIRKAYDNHDCIFYTNGMLNKLDVSKFNDYNEYLTSLSYWSSWSNGFCIWKEDLIKIQNIELNKLFPHTSLFLAIPQKDHYYIDDRYLFDVQRIPKRGGHNKFAAFTIDYPSLIHNQFKQGLIEKKTYKTILNGIMMEMLPNLLFNKYIARIECFSIDNYKENIRLFFPQYAYYLSFLLSPFVPLTKLKNRLCRVLKAK